MQHLRIIAALMLLVFVFAAGCSEKDNPTSVGEGSEGGGEGSEGGGGAGEESATQYTINETCDMVRLGAHLIIAYDAPSNSFIGTVQNNTFLTLQQVRVEIHLSSGVELGPTAPVNLPPGIVHNVVLPVTGGAFATYGAHPEVGSGGGETGGGGEGGEGGGHGGEGGGS